MEAKTHGPLDRQPHQFLTPKDSTIGRAGLHDGVGEGQHPVGDLEHLLRHHHLLGEDLSVTAAFLVITTLVSIDVLMSFVGNRWRLLDHVFDSRPAIVVDRGMRRQ